MIFPLFIARAECIWWKFSSRQFDEKIKNSHRVPIFALLYRPTCEHCHGLPQFHEKYSSQQPNRTDVIFTHINCDLENACYRFPVESFPSYVLVFGEKSRYWPVTHDREPALWEMMIEKYTSFEMKEIKNQREEKKAIKGSMSGGTVFIVDANSPRSDILNIVRTEARKFLLYNDTFYFRVANGTEDRLTAYRSPWCSTEFTGVPIRSEIYAFLDEYKFGHLHRYNEREWFDESSVRSIALSFEDGYISPERINKIAEYSRLFCGNISLGWVKYKKGNVITKKLGLTPIEIPTMVAANKEMQCIASFDINNVSSFRSAMSGKLCMERFNGMWDTALIKMKIKGFKITWALYAAGIITVFLIRLYESYASKDE